ncbi:putative gustatory receptor 2a [Cochliomyia hominivorax]
MDIVHKFLETYLRNTFYLTGFLTIPRFPWLSALLRLCFLSWLSAAVFLMFYWRMNGGDTSVGGLVGTASFVFNGLVNIIIILETIFKSKHFERLNLLQKEVDELLEEYLDTNVKKNMNYHCLTKSMLLMLSCQFICVGLKIWINNISKISPVFWYLMPITTNLRTRYIQIIYVIMTLNRRTQILRDVMKSIVRAHEPKSLFRSVIWQPYDEKDYKKVNYLRLIYLRLWECYVCFNRMYSWSLLTLFMSSFFDIVCNCYWTFTAFYKGQIFHKFVFNGATSASLVSLVYMLFYFTDASENNSRYIGCLVSKLVKPLGNKRYNDLVSEFSIQTLHQRFVITAKEFFNLNLSLLGSMLAAIVTYLVILIQFMFTEKNNRENKLNT